MKQITSKLSLPNIIPQNHSKKLPKKRIKKRNDVNNSSLKKENDLLVNESSRPVLSHDRYVYWKGKQNFIWKFRKTNM
ncbi:unnamed protein product [Rhizophagus irregularis]|uniref:Uncharacterized protein n=1 Tax=Rhizophagus irregularis TaxID=588596 RepID=A0A915ZJL7_9GLOM|nr:unnamed protein product [Rhizophagus irregularis]